MSDITRKSAGKCRKYTAEIVLLGIAVLLCVFIFLIPSGKSGTEETPFAADIEAVSSVSGESMLPEDSVEEIPTEEIPTAVISEEAESEAREREESANNTNQRNAPRIYLTQYTLVLEPDDEFDPVDYLAYLWDDRTSKGELLQRMQISGMENLSEPGVHEVIYTVFDGQKHSSHETVLTVLVEERS